MILQGRVSVGGKVVKELGTKVDPHKIAVTIDGQKIHAERLVYFAVNKPKGFVSTNNDPSGRPRVLDLLPEIPQRVYTVGRLDEMSVGLLLLTNDGELANKLAHPRFGVEKLYRVIVAGSPERDVLNQLTEGIWLAEGKVRAKRVRAVARKGDATILEMVLAEGKNREVRRMLAKLGHKVMMLTRVAVGPVTLKGLAPGQYRPLTGREVDLLRRVAAGEPVPMPWMDARPTRLDTAPPRRPVGPGGDDRRPVRDELGRPGAMSARPGGPPQGRRDDDRPHGPGYRGPAVGAGIGDGPRRDDRRDGPPGSSDRRPGGPPRRPGMFQAAPDDTRRFRDDRPTRPGGPPQGSRGQGRPGDQESRGPGRPPGRPPGAGYQGRPGDHESRGPGRPPGPRSQGRPGDEGPRGPGRPGDHESRGPGRPNGRPGDHESRGPGRPNGRPGDHGPRDQGRPAGRPQQGPPGRDQRPGDRDSRPPRFAGQRPGMDRDRPPVGGESGRPSGPRLHNAEERRPQPPANDGPGVGGARRPKPPARRPPPPGQGEARRKVIGVNSRDVEGSGSGTDDRPKSKLKRPAPRGGAPSEGRPMPKRKPGRRDED